MYLRCAECQATTWIATYEPVGEHDVVCQTCGRRYTLAANEELGATAREQYEYAVRFAETHLIDLPSAYSVLLGIMSVEEAQAAKEQANEKEQASRAAPARPSAPPAGRAAMPEIPTEELYDPGFREAIEAGCLTVQQAIERGSREAYAARLARRHRLPRELAFKVADNRVTLQAANHEVQSRIARARADKERRKPASFVQRALILVFAAAVLAGVGFQSRKVWKRMVDESRAAETNSRQAWTKNAIETAAEPAAEATAGPRVIRTQLRTDPQGRVTQIVGPDPRSVLIAYCDSLPERALRPVELVEAVPPELGTRHGLFRDEEDPGPLYAIRIRRDEQTRRWVAGDGVGPIDARVAPERRAPAQLPPPAP
jgi:hypothetical protein